MDKIFSIDLGARLCYEASLAWEAHFNFEGAISRLHWDEQTEDVKNGYKKMVYLYSQGMGEKNVHDSFVADKLANGFRYGERSVESRTDPYLCEWNMLCDRMKLRYRLFYEMIKLLRHS